MSIRQFVVSDLKISIAKSSFALSLDLFDRFPGRVLDLKMCQKDALWGRFSGGVRMENQVREVQKSKISNSLRFTQELRVMFLNAPLA